MLFYSRWYVMVLGSCVGELLSIVVGFRFFRVLMFTRFCCYAQLISVKRATFLSVRLEAADVNVEFRGNEFCPNK